MHLVNHIRAASWRLEPRVAIAAEEAVVPLRPASPPLVLVQRWIFAPVASTRAASPRPASHSSAAHLHPVR